MWLVVTSPLHPLYATFLFPACHAACRVQRGNAGVEGRTFADVSIVEPLHQELSVTHQATELASVMPYHLPATWARARALRIKFLAVALDEAFVLFVS